MKTLLSTLCISLFILSCKQDSQSIITPENIVGTWLPTYEKFDEIEKKWTSIKTTSPLPGLSFGADSSFSMLYTLGSTEYCCGIIGNKYTVEDRVIKFTDRITCPNVKCAQVVNCTGWSIRKLEGDILEINQCPDGIYRFKRTILLISSK